MALNNRVDQWFETKFESDIKHKFQQMSSMLMNRVFTVRDVEAQTVSFPILDKGTVTKNKPSHADQDPETEGHSSETVTLDDYTTGRYVGKLDVRKFTGAVYDKYVENMAGTAGREMDDIILTAVDAGTTSGNSNIDETSGGLTYSKLSTGVKNFHKTGAFSVPGSKTLVVDEEGWEDLVAISEFKSSDFVSYRVAEQGTVPMIMGFEVSVVVPDVIPNRDVSTAPSFAYLIHENALALAVASDVSTEINYVGQKFSDFVGMSFSAGAKNILPNGTFRIDVGQS